MCNSLVTNCPIIVVHQHNYICAQFIEFMCSTIHPVCLLMTLMSRSRMAPSLKRTPRTVFIALLLNLLHTQKVCCACLPLYMYVWFFVLFVEFGVKDTCSDYLILSMAMFDSIPQDWAGSLSRRNTSVNDHAYCHLGTCNQSSTVLGA